MATGPWISPMGDPVGKRDRREKKVVGGQVIGVQSLKVFPEERKKRR